MNSVHLPFVEKLMLAVEMLVVEMLAGE